MTQSTMSTERREFLSGIAITAAAAGLSVAAAGSAPALAADAPVTDFTRWLDSISGKQRIVLDVREPNGGMALAWAWVYLFTGPQAYGVPESDMGAVMVFRHNAIPLALEDAMWKKYKLGEYFKIDDPLTKAPAVRNPFYLKPEEPLIPDMALQKLIDRGVKAVACDMAIHYYSGELAKQMDLKHDDVKAEWMKATLPKVAHAPSGVVACHGAVSRGCAYIFAG